jgi:hypothetical protein
MKQKKAISKWYKNWRECPMSAFKYIMNTGDINFLIIEGEPTMQELNLAWDDILYSYSQSLAGPEQRQYLITLRQLHHAQATLLQIEILIDNLRRWYVPQFEDMLNKLARVKWKLNVHNPKEYDEYLNRHYNRSRSLVVQIDLLKDQAEHLEKSFNTSGTNVDEEFFDRDLITLSDHAGFPITDRISVFEYCERKKRLFAFVNKSKKENNARRRY